MRFPIPRNPDEDGAGGPASGAVPVLPLAGMARPVRWWRRPEHPLWCVLAGAASLLLMIAAFPPGRMPEAAWLVAVPALLWAYTAPRWKAFLWTSWLAQAAAWFILLIWLRHVTWVGLVLLAAFLGAWQTLWFAAARRLLPGSTARPVAARLLLTFGLAGLWVVLEWGRTWIFSGFPWLPLAASQWQRPMMLGFAPWTGAWGVSFALILFNVGLAAYLRRLHEFSRQGMRRLSPEFMVAALVVLGGSFGLLQGRFNQKTVKLLDVALVQPDIPQEVKWDKAREDENMEVLRRTTLPMGWFKPDLVLLPEASVAPALNADPELQPWIEALARDTGASLLMGVLEVLPGEDGRWRWYNAACLVGPQTGLSPESYAKRKRVPFGEYVPLRPLLGWIGKFAPVGGDLDAGASAAPLTVTAQGRWLRTGVLICYEDIFPGLARDSVRAGAEMLVVLTNNAWFGEGAAAHQHAAHSVLRAAETRRPVVRCGNAGWSGWIDEYGNIRAILADENGSIYFRGGTSLEVTRDIRWAGILTPYARYGDWFVAVSAILAGAAFWVLRPVAGKGRD